MQTLLLIFVIPGNVLMLIMSCVTHNFCLGGAVSPCGINLDLTPLNYLQIILVLEVALILPLLTKHIGMTMGSVGKVMRCLLTFSQSWCHL